VWRSPLGISRCGTAQRVTRELVNWLAPGSYLVISTASGDEKAVASQMQSEYTANSTWNHSREVIRSFFAGTELMAPGLADAGEWLPGAAATTPTPKSIRIIAGIGRIP
jgi:S-adenosyl methyltransferase